MGKHNRTLSGKRIHKRQPSLVTLDDLVNQKSQWVRSRLTMEQSTTLNNFMEVMSDIEDLDDKRFCDEACLCRYLRARDWNIKAAEKMLRNTLAWRKTFKPELLNPIELENEASSGKLYRRGHDKHGRPVLIMTPRYENSKDYTKNVQLVVYQLERCIEEMPSDVEQLLLVIDFKGYSRKNAPPFSVSKEVLSILSNHYPERLGKAIMIDCPFLFSLFWRAIKPFIHPVTADKVQFISGSADDKKEKLSHYIDLDGFEPRFGGTGSEFIVKDYWDLEIAHHKKKQKRLAKRARNTLDKV